MAKPDWEAIETAYRAGVLSLRDIGTKYGISEGAIRKRANKHDWVRKGGTQVRKNGTQAGTQNKGVRTTGSRASKGVEEKYADENSAGTPETKYNSRSGNPAPSCSFPRNHRASVKHGGYGRRLLHSTEVAEDALAMTIDDELYMLRAASLEASESIGRWKVMLEDAQSDDVVAELRDNISKAQQAMNRNAATIGTLETIRANLYVTREMPAKVIADVEYRKAATERLKLEADRIRRDIPGENEKAGDSMAAFYEGFGMQKDGDGNWKPDPTEK